MPTLPPRESHGQSSQKKVAVLGVGRVGAAIAIDLARTYQVAALDPNAQSLKPLQGYGVEPHIGSAADGAVLKSFIENSDLVINAVPGKIGFGVLERVIANGKNVVDISFYPEDPFLLHALASKRDVTAVVDCGVAPGLSNMFLGYHHARMQVENFSCYVGGLPRTRTWPYQYKAPFSPSDVIEEYVRPARLVEGGAVVVKPALSEIERIDCGGIATLEAFNTDGLRTLLTTMKVPDMKEKTLRYPGHGECMRILRDSGFFGTEPIRLAAGNSVTPLEMTSRILFPLWQLAQGEKEFTVMRVVISGVKKNVPVTYTYTLYDEYNEKTKTTSMARTTGYTCTAVAHLMLKGKILETGILAPEQISRDKKTFGDIIGYLLGKGISIKFEQAP